MSSASKRKCASPSAKAAQFEAAAEVVAAASSESSDGKGAGSDSAAAAAVEPAPKRATGLAYARLSECGRVFSEELDRYLPPQIARLSIQYLNAEWCPEDQRTVCMIIRDDFSLAFGPVQSCNSNLLCDCTPIALEAYGGSPDPTGRPPTVTLIVATRERPVPESLVLHINLEEHFLLLTPLNEDDGEPATCPLVHFHDKTMDHITITREERDALLALALPLAKYPTS
jgi:hypothetical protein